MKEFDHEDLEQFKIIEKCLISSKNNYYSGMTTQQTNVFNILIKKYLNERPSSCSTCKLKMLKKLNELYEGRNKDIENGVEQNDEDSQSSKTDCKRS